MEYYNSLKFSFPTARRYRAKHLAGFLLIALFADGCDFIGRNTSGLLSSSSSRTEKQERFTGPREDSKTTKVSVLELEQRKRSDVQIVWQVPEQAVDSYTIKYGYSHDNLEFSLELNMTEVTIYEDPAYGLAYRYVLKGIPPEKDIFISMIGHHGGESSEPTEIYEVKAVGPAKF